MTFKHPQEHQSHDGPLFDTPMHKQIDLVDAIKEAPPPDPENMNEDRAEWAREALQTFAARTGTDADMILTDLLCDLMHWADRFLPDGDSWEAHLTRAADHYSEEIRAH